MSNTYEIVCKDCKEGYWFGQSSSNGATTIYKPEIFMRWLIKHSCCGEIAIINGYSGNYPEWYDASIFKILDYEYMRLEEAHDENML